MIKASNERIAITLSKKQVKWIKQQAKMKDITPSKFIAWLIGLKISEIDRYLRATNEDIAEDLERMKTFQDLMKERTMEDLIRIAKTPWIKDNK